MLEAHDLFSFTKTNMIVEISVSPSERKKGVVMPVSSQSNPAAHEAGRAHNPVTI